MADGLGTVGRIQVSKLATGMDFVVALTNDHELWSWGLEECNGRPGKKDHPTQVLVGDGKVKIIDIACSEHAAACIDSEGRIWMWGTFRVFRI